MTDTFTVAQKDEWKNTTFFDTYADAEKAAKNEAADDREDVFIFKAIAVARAPVADVAVDKL